MHRSLTVGLLAAALALFSPGADGSAHEADGHPARIQKGSCTALGGVAFQLTGACAAITLAGTPEPAPELTGAESASSLKGSETTLETSLSTLTKEPHAIVVYESDEAMDRIIACGDVGGLLTAQMPGMVMPGDELAIWLAAVNDSGYAGLALLRAEGTEATLRLFLNEGAPEGGHAETSGSTAEATPHAG